ncbi:MAG: hypothetical protein HKN32_07510, partial [Flavobacteriales bacterium]|nr:hypothetical protein [Flavobacteriales bacterium]
MRDYLILICVLLTMASAGPANGQFFPHRFDNESGLPNELVKATAVDSLGFVWSATDGGLVRYNGERFDVVEGDFESTYFKWVFAASDGRIYITSDDGFFEAEYSLSGQNIRQLVENSNYYDENTVSFPKNIYEDADGTIWVSDDRGIGSWKDEQWKYYFLDDTNVPYCFTRAVMMTEVNDELYAYTNNSRALIFNEEEDKFEEIGIAEGLFSIEAVAPWKNGKVLIGSNQQLIATTPGSSEFEIVHPHLHATTLVNQEDNSVLIGTWNHGIMSLNSDENGFKLNPLIDGKDINCISHIHVKGDQYWVSSDNGLYYLENQPFTTLVKDDFFTFCEDYLISPEGILAISENRLVKLHEQGVCEELIRHTTGFEEIALVRGTTYISDVEGRVFQLIGNKLHLLFDWSRDGKAVNSIYEDKRGVVWLVRNEDTQVFAQLPSGELVEYGHSKGIEGEVLFLKASRDGTIYIGGKGDNSYLYR